MAIEVEALLATVKAAEPLTTLFSLLAAVLSGICAWLSFKLARSIRDELKSDEIIVSGVLHNPALSHPDHENCVIRTTLFNKSKRKAFVSQIRMFDSKNSEIDIAWSNTIDAYGNPQDRSGLLGIVDSTSLCIRRNDGLAIRSARVEVSHSFSTTPMVLTYDMGPGWQEYFAK